MSEYNEELFEEGIVESVSNGTATIIVNSSDQCDDCSAKVYCKPKDAEGRKLVVKDPIGASVGDKVRISTQGKNLLFASLYLYAIPLILLLTSLIIGMKYFTVNPELFSFLTGLVILAIYFFILWRISGKINTREGIMPKIVTVYRKAID